MSTPILSVEDLVVAYGHVEAVRGVSFHADAGSLVTLVIVIPTHLKIVKALRTGELQRAA